MDPEAPGPPTAVLALASGALLSDVGVAAHIWSVELDQLTGRDNVVEDRFRDERIVQRLLPVLGIEFRGHHGGIATFPPGEDVQQFSGRVRGDRRG